MNPGQRGRKDAKFEIIVAVVATLVVALIYVSAPGTIEPMFAPHPPDWLLAVPIVGVAVGLAWMVRIYRAKPEPDHGAWRYRSKRPRRSTTEDEPSQPDPPRQPFDGS